MLTFPEYKEIISNQNFIDGIYSNNIFWLLKKWRKYDLVLDFGQFSNYSALAAFILGKNRIGYSHGIRSNLYNGKIKFNDKQHMAYTFFDLLRPLFNIKYPKKLVRISYTNSKRIDILIKNLRKNSNKIIGMHIGASTLQKKRCWPKQNFINLIKKILSNSRKIKIVLVGSNSEKKDCEEVINNLTPEIKSRVINTAGMTNLNDLVNLISQIDGFVGNDSGPMHIAAAQNIKTLGIFGPNTPVRYRPLNSMSHYVYNPKLCSKSPCINVHTGSGEPYKRCKSPLCLEGLSTNEVYNKFKKYII